jgi:hypothetical protein
MVAVCVLGALGCGDESSPAPAPGATTPDPFERPAPSPYDPSIEGETPEATLTAEQAATALPQIVADLRLVAPLEVLALHDALLAHADETCPGDYPLPTEEGETSNIWVNDCIASDGTEFYGYVQRSEFTRPAEDGATDTGFIFSSGGNFFEMEAPDGTFLRGALYYEAHTLTYPDGQIVHYAYKSGDLLADEASAGDNPWLKGDIGGDFGLYAYDSMGYRMIQFDGAFATASHPAISALQLHEFSVDAFACPLSALGGASLRGKEGGWHEASFGDPELIGTGAECNACADYTFAGAPLGDMCAESTSLEDLLTWETTPW